MLHSMPLKGFLVVFSLFSRFCQKNKLYEAYFSLGQDRKKMATYYVFGNLPKIW